MRKIAIFFLFLSLVACNQKKQAETQNQESDIQLIICGDSKFIHQPNENVSVEKTLEHLKKEHPELKISNHGERYVEDGMGKGWSMQIFTKN